MPFLLGVNMWGYFYRPKDKKLRERAHGDRVMFGYNTVEALEEYFFKVQLKDAFIGENGLSEHQITEKTYQDYLDYQKLVGRRSGRSVYLAKNNNLILRYKSMREMDPEFKVVMLFRDPLDHATSLQKQHLRFTAMQKEDPFVLEYMNWLGHHEFGQNHKPFLFDDMMDYGGLDWESLDYWIISWINYYSHVLKMGTDENLILVDYSDFLTRPDSLLRKLESKLKIPLAIDRVEPFFQQGSSALPANEELVSKANSLFAELCRLKLTV